MSYFTSDHKYIYLDYQYAEFYIPSYFFESSGGFAEDRGGIIHVLGLLDVGFFKDGKLVETRVFNVPTFIDLFVSNSEDRSVKLPGEEGEQDCKVVMYNRGEKITNSTIIQDSSNAEAYLDFIMKGKIPPIVPYNKTAAIWDKNQRLNDAYLGVPGCLEELILSASYRYKEDPTKKYSSIAGKSPNASEFDYVMKNIRQICQYTSTFNGLTFEDFDSMVTTSLNRTREHIEEPESPIEAILKL